MANKQDERGRRILQLLSEKKRMEVAALAEILGISQVTVRKDLDGLEERGFIRRMHGFAVLNTTDRISSRLAYHYEEKRRIAERAAALVHDGDTVMLESGSCCAILADILAHSREAVTIVTNSAFIAEYVRESRAQVILLGGVLQRDSQCLVGPMLRDAAANFHVRFFFIGTDGWSERTGFGNKDPLRAQAVRDMARSCDEMVVLTESEKFRSQGTVPLNVEAQPRRVITDGGVPAPAADRMRAQGIELLTTED